MTIETHQMNLPFSDSMREFIDQKIRAKLRRHVDRVGRVVVRLADGPHGGGADKVCKVRVELDQAAPIVAVGESRDVYAAILDAASKLGHAVDRQLGRRLTHRAAHGRSHSL